MSNADDTDFPWRNDTDALSNETTKHEYGLLSQIELPEEEDDNDENDMSYDEFIHPSLREPNMLRDDFSNDDEHVSATPSPPHSPYLADDIFQSSDPQLETSDNNKQVNDLLTTKTINPPSSPPIFGSNRNSGTSHDVNDHSSRDETPLLDQRLAGPTCGQIPKAVPKVLWCP